MSKQVATAHKIAAENSEHVLLKGDLSVLNSEQKLSYYKTVCDSLGLNTLTKPFEYIRLNGKEVLYATRACTDQLRSVHKISIEITDRQKIDNLYIVTAKATNKEGRADESTGAIDLSNLKGDVLANALMKCETKAKRRVTLSICGLGMLDETEVASIPGVVRTTEDVRAVALKQIEDNFPKENPVNKEARFAAEAPFDPPKISSYRIPIGRKFKGKTFDECGVDDLAGYCDWLRKTYSNPKGELLEFLNLASEYLEGVFTEDTPAEQSNFEEQKIENKGGPSKPWG